MTIPKYKQLIDDAMLESLKVRSQMDQTYPKEETILSLIQEIEGLKEHIKILEGKSSAGF